MYQLAIYGTEIGACKVNYHHLLNFIVVYECGGNHGIKADGWGGCILLWPDIPFPPRVVI